MVKKVKIPEDNLVLGGDEINDYEDDLSLDGTSQGENSKASEDASDYEDDPKGAPGRLHFGDDRCRKIFQLTKDVEDGTARVCGGPVDCNRKGHKRTVEQGKPGVYDTIKTQHYVDGIFGTHRTVESQQRSDAEAKALLLSLTGKLTGSATYQEVLQSMERELAQDEKGDTESGLDSEAWDDRIDESDLKMPGKTKSDGSTGLKPMKITSTLAPRERGTPKTKTAQADPATSDPMVYFVKEVKDALQDMTATIVKATQGRPTPTTAIQGSDTEDSEEEVTATPRRSKGGGGPRKKAARKDDYMTDSEDDEQPRSRKSRGGSKTKWYYAVARGRRPGVYTDWGEAEKQVNGFSGSLHQKFNDRKRAQKFVDKHRSRKHADADEDSDATGSGTDVSSGGDAKPKGKPMRTKPHQEGIAFPPLALTAPDPSTGNSKELFKMTLASDNLMTEKLSPPGLDVKTREALADATLDAIQLPGTSLEETADATGDLVGALREMTEDRRNDWSYDRPQKDSLWKARSRTSLLSIKTEDDMRERLNELSGLPEEMFENQVHRFTAILSNLHWSQEAVHAWACCNWFLRLGKDTLENYVALHLHLVTLSNNESWSYAQEALKHYATKLSQFRKTSTSRLLCLIKIYIFLRDARKNDFYSPKLQEKRNRAMMTKISTLEMGGTTGGGSSGKNGCKKCGLEHQGGFKKCPLKGLSDGEAKKRVEKFLAALAKMSNEDAAKFLKTDEE